MEVKTCIACHKEFEDIENNFRKQPINKSGFVNTCNSCVSIKGKQYCEKNKEKIKKYRQENKKERCEKHKQYLLENKERLTK